MIVVDASALVRYLARAGADAGWVAARLRPEPELHAPELIDTETLHGLRRLVIAEVVGAEAGSAAVRDLLDAPIVRYPHRPFVERAWALRGQLTACDGLYVALAEALGATLVTTDRELARAVTTVDVVAPA